MEKQFHYSQGTNFYSLENNNIYPFNNSNNNNNNNNINNNNINSFISPIKNQNNHSYSIEKMNHNMSMPLSSTISLSPNHLYTNNNNNNIQIIYQSKEYKALLTKNQMLQSQITQLKYRNQKLKKQMQIWQQIQTQSKTQSGKNQFSYQNIIKESQQKENSLNSKINKLNQQISTLYSTKSIIEKQNQELKQKISDFKYHNQQLKSLNQKLNTIHKKQIEIMQKDKNIDQQKRFSMIDSSQQYQDVKRQNKILEGKLQQCKQIVKEMQEYYANQISSLKAEIQDYESQINNLKEIIKKSQQQTDIIRDQANRQKNQLKKIIQQISLQKNRQKQQEQFSTMVKSQNKDKKWQLMIQKIKDNYQKEAFHLKNQIKYLLIKLQSYQENQNRVSQQPQCKRNFSQSNNLKFNLQNYNDENEDFDQPCLNNIFTQSKLSKENKKNNEKIMGRGFSQCFKFTPLQSPNTSFSSSIKQSLTKRDMNMMNSSGGNIKTPNKHNKSMKNPRLYQKTNF